MTILRRLCAVLIAVVLGGIATPGTSWARDGDRNPRITVTDIVAPEGQTVSFYPSTQIDARGTVLLTVAGISAIWHRGRFDAIRPPVDEPLPVVGTLDLSDHGQVAVGVTNLPPCEGSVTSLCPRPFLWDDGEVTMLPTDGVGGTALKVAKRGSVVTGLLLRPGGAGFASELAGWVDGELVRGPEGAGDDSETIALNERGQALIHMQVDGETQLAVWDVGKGVTDLGAFGGGTTVGVDINDRGDIVGWRNNPETGTSGGFLWREGETIDLGPIEPVDVNDRGQVVGECSDPELPGIYTCLWDDGELTGLGNEAEALIPPLKINNLGQVIGQANVGGPDGDEFHAFLWQEGQLIDLSAASGFNGPSEAVDINDRGQIAGVLGNPLEGERHVVWTVSR